MLQKRLLYGWCARHAKHLQQHACGGALHEDGECCHPTHQEEEQHLLFVIVGGVVVGGVGGYVHVCA